MKFEEALKERLDTMQPSASDVERFLQQRPPRITQGIPKLVSALHGRQTAVYLISGGFRGIIAPIADQLGIDRSHVYANTICFHVPNGISHTVITLSMCRKMGVMQDSMQRSSPLVAEAKQLPCSPSKSVFSHRTPFIDTLLLGYPCASPHGYDR